jgi:4-diphosphocytidyl-2-C-methyl-D-erythritol kinase
MTVAEFAAAKVNLTLHVTGRRPDGYHLLDSLVCFASVGDAVHAAPAADLSLTLTGPESAGLRAEPDNLVLRAARSMGQVAALVLDKRLPVASGIGGGSADAAATLRALARLTGAALPDPATVLRLGADVPVCLSGRVCRMQGVGEVLAPAPALPPVWAVLANPRVHVATPDVFRALAVRENPPMPLALPDWHDAQALAAWLALQRNDLEPAAIAVAPAIGDVLGLLRALPGALLARMSGSGATCLALFASETAACDAAARLKARTPGWWVAAARLGDAPVARP